MKPSIIDQIRERVIVADGGMGTMLYAKGIYVNQCYDAMNVNAADLVRDIHTEYIKAGAELIETNTFGANPLKLSPHGLAGECEAINGRGAELARDVAGDRAWVGGSVGPLGKPLSPIGKISVAEATEHFRPQIRGLVKGGVDLLIIETMSDLQEMAAAVAAARLECDLPLLTMATFPAEGRTLVGYTPEEVMTAMTGLGAAVVGANCSEGPHDMLASVERLHVANPKMLLAAMPNAGSPRMVDGRVLYMTSPDYLAEYARRFINAGAALIGGCCGTTPDHIRAIAQMVKALRPAKGSSISVTPLEKAKTVEPVPIQERSPLGAKLAKQSVLGRKFVVSVEMNPPRGHDASKVLQAAEKLRFHGVDVVNVPDGPRASARMGALHIAVLIQQKVGMETVLHYTCRDRNLLGMQGDILGAYALGLRNILAVTGDPPKLGDYPGVTAVYDVESIGLVRVLEGLNHGVDLAANPIGEPGRFLIGVGANPGAADIERELKRFRYKVEAGANFCMTQPVFEQSMLEAFLEKIADVRIPVLVGILPLASHRNAEFLHNEVPGMQIPQAVRDRMRVASDKEGGAEEGVLIAQETLSKVKHLVEGAYIMPPFGRIDAALKVLEAL
jgi:methionine synthase / methylenetetrahydrofolate reductase(NADPH)